MLKAQFIDVHGHVQFPVFDGDRREVMQKAAEAGVKMIAVGTQAKTSKRAIEIANEFPDSVWATVGFHPDHVGDGGHHDKNEYPPTGGETGPLASPKPPAERGENFDIRVLRELALDPKVVAISECGFDLFRRTDTQKAQEEVFSEQANLARELNKPLMMHCRPSKGTDDAYEYALGVLKDQKFNSLFKIMHFYAGSLDMAKKLSDLGFYFTFGGVITFSNSYDEIIKYLPLDRIFTETDCPYVAPQSHRGKRNEPAYVIETVRRLAEIKGMDFEKAADELYKNSVEVFNLK